MCVPIQLVWFAAKIHALSTLIMSALNSIKRHTVRQRMLLSQMWGTEEGACVCRIYGLTRQGRDWGS